MNRVAVTGLGIISAIGNSPAAFFASALAGRSGICRATELATGPWVPLVASAAFDATSVHVRQRGASLDRATAMALAATRQAIADAGVRVDAPSPRAGVYWGTGMGSAATVEDNYETVFGAGNWRLKPTTVVTAMNNAAAAEISVEFRLTGPSITYCVACASSAVAIGEAMRAIRLGVIDWAVAGGSEASLTRGILAAWAPLRTLAREDPDDPARSCKPFSVERSGFVLGEGAAALIVENAERAKRRQARVYAELAGYAVTSDGTHISDPSPDGQARAIRMALDDAEISPGEVGYLNAHGTATLLGDRVETVSLKRALGSHVAEVPVSSTKAVHGHVMGATGAIEAIAAILALHSGSIPPTAHLDQPSPDLDLDYVPNTARYGNALSAVVSNSFGFGGTNAVLVARNPAARLAPTQG